MKLNPAVRDALARETETTPSLVDALADAVTRQEHDPLHDNDVLLRDFVVLLRQEAYRR